jgi:hypothetical protein
VTLIAPQAAAIAAANAFILPVMVYRHRLVNLGDKRR